MRVIYTPAGKAREYSPLALNIYNGCSNACSYCYVPIFCKKDRESFKKAFPRDILKKLEIDCRELQALNNEQHILLSFACDPYQEIDKELKITRKVIETLNNYGQPFQVLTKNGNLAIRDFDLYKKTDCYATTLTLDNEKDSLFFEPRADLPEVRINSLVEAKKRNIKTWVSIEPVIFPEQSLNLIKKSIGYVDLFKIGKLNHFKEMESKIDWKQFAENAIRIMDDNNKAYYIKKDLAVYLN